MKAKIIVNRLLELVANPYDADGQPESRKILDRLFEAEPLLHPHSLLVCTLNKNFRPFARLDKFSTRVLECREVKKNASPLRLLVLSKQALPDVGRNLAEVFPG